MPDKDKNAEPGNAPTPDAEPPEAPNVAPPSAPDAAPPPDESEAGPPPENPTAEAEGNGDRPRRPQVSRPATSPEDGAVMTSRLQRQQRDEAASIAQAEERQKRADEKAASKDARAAATEVADQLEQLARTTNPDLSTATVILDANSIKQQRIAQVKALAPRLMMDKARPGGEFMVDGKLVNANGQPIASR